MGELTIRDLAAEARVGLRLHARGDAAETRVMSAHTSDLAHPAPYVLPGELVLTNGLWLDQVSAEKWIAEIAEAGAIGVGFGLSELYSEVPKQLVSACGRHGLPLIEVPKDVAFSRVTEYVHERTATGTTSGLRRQLLRTRRLVGRLTAGGGHDALLSLLLAETGLSAAFVGPGGRIIAAAGEKAVDPDTARRASIAALRQKLPWAIADEVCVFGVPMRFPASCLLVHTAMRTIPDESRLFVEQVATYGAFLDVRAEALEDARRTMTEELVSLVLADQVGDRAFETRVRSLGLDPGLPIAPVASDVPLALLRYAAEASGAVYAVAQLDSCQLLLLQDQRKELVDEVAATLREMGTEPVMGCAGLAVGCRALRRSLVEASAALRFARAHQDGDRLVHEIEIGSHALLLELLEPEELDAYRNVILGPLRRWDDEHGSALVETLRVFLQLGGHWREAAARLHIHHNTLRYRLERVEELTGKKLSETGNRVDLFLALAADASHSGGADD